MQSCSVRRCAACSGTRKVLTEYSDHDWIQSRPTAVSPNTHLFVETIVVPRQHLVSDDDYRAIAGPTETPLYIKRTGQAVTLFSLSYFKRDTALCSLTNLFFLMCQPVLNSYFRNPVTGKLKRCFVFITDNSRSVAPASILVQMLLVRFCRMFNLDKVVQKSFTEYHYKRNFVESVHAVENEALPKHGPLNSHQVHGRAKAGGGSPEHKENMPAMAKDTESCLNSGVLYNKQPLHAFQSIKKVISCLMMKCG